MRYCDVCNFYIIDKHHITTTLKSDEDTSYDICSECIHYPAGKKLYDDRISAGDKWITMENNLPGLLLIDNILNFIPLLKFKNLLFLENRNPYSKFYNKFSVLDTISGSMILNYNNYSYYDAISEEDIPLLNNISDIIFDVKNKTEDEDEDEYEDEDGDEDSDYS